MADYSNNNNTNYSNPDVGGYSSTNRLKDLDAVYVLPTGRVWQGEVFQLEDGTWVTGTSLTKASVVVARVAATPEFPNSGLVAKGAIFRDVFQKVKDWSSASEGSVESIANKLIKYENKLLEMDKILDLAFDKIVSFIQMSNMHNEEAGQGQINDFNLDFTLDIDTATDLNGRISSINYIHFDETETYIFDGFVDTGLVNGGLESLDTSAIRLDMVSRTDAPVSATIEELLLSKHFSPGFNGLLSIELSQATPITSIRLPIGGSITAVKFDGELLSEYTHVSDVISFKATTVNKVELQIEYTSPMPFISWVSNDFQEDLLGNPQVDQTQMNPPVYQKTSLDLGPVKLSSVSYKTEKTFELGPYDIKAGSLRSISINPQEVLHDYVDSGSYFEYSVVVAGVEYPLTPWNREGNSPRIYYVNVNLSDSTKSSLAEEHHIGFIDTNSPEIKFNINVKLIRPEDQYITPLLQGITVNYSTSLDGGYNG